ncbi:AAA family ATPase [Brachyspira aalborgi]|uniref:AAA family ATPase n=1 Tax=Brachyspira aalborgi TaxID=29522 RepID=UPI00039E3B43|nr:AAA family ATPase [Brachyspira aalborgi]
MSEYIYFGSKWGEKKKPLLNIFLNHKVAFAGLGSLDKVNNYKKKFKKDTKIAIKEGTEVKAVGIAEEDFNSLNNLGINFSDEELEQFDYAVDETVLAVKVKLFKLSEEDCFKYPAAIDRCKPIKSNEDIINKIDKLIKKYSGEKMKEEIKELLIQNKNLILTGAPGTGKTYLAKQVASKIILNKDYDESVENDINFKEQCAFVQFHPSYDYTDFVEGLRPKNDNGNIGFERKDGVFKAFCKKALKNLKDSQKDITTLNYDEIIKKYLEDFYNDVSVEIADNSEGYKIHGIGGGIAAPIIEINYNKSEAELDYTVKTKNGNEYKFNNKLDLIADYYKKFVSKKPNEWKYKDFVDTLNVKGYHTYIYGFLKSFYDKYNEKIEQEKNNITVQEVEKRDFVFIIDEINRGEISKIFGELFFSVDSGYRGEKGKVQTQYANLIEDGDQFKDGFYIPENVYIIGTMNDIDRSVESMDFAMRRRFAWKEIKAEDTQNMLDEYKWENKIDADIIQSAKEKMNKLNEAISNTQELSDAYNIGASYFLKLNNYYKDNNKKEAFKKLWENHLNIILFEYTRGMPNQKDIIDKLKKEIIEE